MPTFDPGVYEIICMAISVFPQPGAKCDPRQWREIPLILTLSEFCDPNDNKNKRFVELYSPNKRNYRINDDLILMKWIGTNPSPSYSFQPLKGATIDENGFLVVCINWVFWGTEKCEISSGFNSFAELSGTENIALARCNHPFDDTCDCIDTYGVPGIDAATASQVFTNGRAWRKHDSLVIGSKIFNIGQWEVTPNVSSDKCDPGKSTSAPSPTLLPVPTSSTPLSWSSEGNIPSNLGKRVRK